MGPENKNKMKSSRNKDNKAHSIKRHRRNKRKSPKKWKTKLFGWFLYQVLDYKSNI